MDDPTPGVQPGTAPANPEGAAPAGQGAETGGSDLTSHLLSSVSPAFRPDAERLLGEWNKSAQQKFQEAAEYRKQWEPYEALNLPQIPQEELTELLQFREIAQDPQRFAEWHRQIGDLLAEGEEPEGEPGVETDPEASNNLPPEVQQKLQQFEEWMQHQEAERAVQETASRIRGQLDGIRKENPDLTDEDEEMICTLALKYEDQDAVQKGFADFQKFASRFERGVFEQKSGGPEPAVSGGSNATATKPVTSFEEAAAMARERLAQSRAT